MTTNKQQDLARLAEYLAKERPFGAMTRFRRQGYELESELELVEAIGKFRTPDFVIDEENRFAYENFIRWCNGDQEMQAINPLTGEPQEGDLGKGIYIAGNPGSGKSWLLEVMREYARYRDFRIEFPKDRWSSQVLNRPLAWTVERADDICRRFASDGSIDSFRYQRVLGIQDLGQEPQETLHMGNRTNVLTQLLEYRGDIDDQLTLITSNLRMEGDLLRQRYGDRVQSRLFGMCNYLVVRGKDRRRG